MNDLDPAKPAQGDGENGRRPGHATKLRARHEFDSWAQGYDHSIVQHLLFQPAYRMFMEELYAWRQDDPRPFSLLDIGCGTGTWIAMVAGSGLPADRLVGLDYSQGMIGVAEKKAEAVPGQLHPHFVNGDSEHLPFADGSFDLVTCSHSFHHYPHQSTAVAEMYRVLRPEGRLMIIDGFRDNVVGWVLYDVMITRAESTPSAKVFHAPWSLMRRYFSDAGFREIHQRKTGVLAPIFITTGTR